MQRYMPTFFQAAGDIERWAGMKEDSEDGDWYSREEVETHIAEMQRSHDASTAALKGELTQAQQAIHRMTVEAKTADQRLSVAKERIEKLEQALRLIVGLSDLQMRDGDEARDIANRVLMVSVTK
jgi:hypothetical protein